MEKDMTAGTPGKIIFNFTMPIFIGNIFQQFYNMADRELRRDLRLLQHSTSEPET